MILKLQNKKTGEVCERKVGFSWTSLFLGPIVPIYRREYGLAVIEVLLGLMTFGLSKFVFPFIYNRLSIEQTLEKGFVPIFAEDEKVLRDKKFSDIWMFNK